MVCPGGDSKPTRRPNALYTCTRFCQISKQKPLRAGRPCIWFQKGHRKCCFIYAIHTLNSIGGFVPGQARLSPNNSN